MGTKSDPGAYDCYAKAAPDEPMFVLLARDPDAAILVNLWADLREHRIEMGSKPASDLAMVDEARDCARRMRSWYQRRQDEREK